IIDGGDRRGRAFATFERTEILLREGEITPEETIKALDRLRHVWRGDGFEIKVLLRLGELQIETEDYRAGLRTLRRAVTNFPERNEVARLTGLMQATFRRLYLDGEADNLPAVTAIALFNEFRELTPAGSDGDEMIRRLADRMVAVDLLDRAAELLTHQVRFRLNGPEKASIGARLAKLQLLDRQPAAALESLHESRLANVPEDLARERRFVEARAHALLGNNSAALALIENDRDREADQIRAHVLWRARDWSAASDVYTRLIGDAPGDGEALDEERSRYVLNLAVSLFLAGRHDRLIILRRDFGSAMATGPFAYDFRVVTSPNSSPADIEGALTRVAAVDDFRAFMEQYRARIASRQAEYERLLEAEPNS
ncbi:MAG: hypothetical protein ACE5Q3_16655, partial [Alphaproteobacteria bacterium]